MRVLESLFEPVHNELILVCVHLGEGCNGYIIMVFGRPNRAEFRRLCLSSLIFMASMYARDSNPFWC